MAVKFSKDLQVLVADVGRAGYTIESVQEPEDARGCEVEIHLTNGVVINWDQQTKRIWAEGPLTLAKKTETFLRRLYEGGPLQRWWALNPVLMLGALAAAFVLWLLYLGSALNVW